MKDRIAERLREVAMPPEEIRAVLTTDDDKLVHRYIELHRERLAEELQARSRSLDTVERALAARGRVGAARQAAAADSSSGR